MAKQMAKQKSAIPKFMKYSGSVRGPADLSSRRGFETRSESQHVRRKKKIEGAVGFDSVYLLYHLRKENPDSDTQLLLIGAYRSQNDAKAAIDGSRANRVLQNIPKVSSITLMHSASKIGATDSKCWPTS
jgi:hypothetical protein